MSVHTPETEVKEIGSEGLSVKVGGVSEGEEVTTLIASVNVTSLLTRPVQLSSL